MKIECDLCHKTAEMAEMLPKPGGMDIRCGACGGWFFAPARAPVETPPAPMPGPAAVPRPTGPPCPKCGRIRGAEEACQRCGLVYALWTGDAAPNADLDDRARALWLDAERIWSDAARHQAFIDHCVAAGLLAAAGRQYRARLDLRPDDAIASGMQLKIVALASNLLGPHSTAGVPVTRTRGFWMVMAGGLFVGILLAVLFG